MFSENKICHGNAVNYDDTTIVPSVDGFCLAPDDFLAYTNSVELMRLKSSVFSTLYFFFQHMIFTLIIDHTLVFSRSITHGDRPRYPCINHAKQIIKVVSIM